MEAYKPPQAPLLRRTLGHPAVQLVFVLIVGAGVVLSLWKREQDSIDDRVRYLKSGAQVAASTNSRADSNEENPGDLQALAGDTIAAQEATDLTEEASNMASAEGDLEKSRAATTLTTSEAALNGAAPTPAPTPGATTTPTTGERIVFRLTAMEVSSRYLQQVLYPDSRQTGQFNNIGDYVAGLIPDLGRRMAGNNPDLKLLLKEERAIEVGRALNFFQGLRAGDPLNELGFTYHILLNQADRDNYRAQIEIVRSAKLPGSPGTPAVLQKTPFPADFDLTEGSAFFMVGLMARGTPPESENELVAIRPFQILRSSAFRSQASEYVIFIEFDRQ